MDSSFWNIDELLALRETLGKKYFEFLRILQMSAGVYVLAARGEDTQSPHEQDELYYVVRGRARMKAGDADEIVCEGSVIFVPANQEHRFYDIQEELTLLVFFAPAESS